MRNGRLHVERMDLSSSKGEREDQGGHKGKEIKKNEEIDDALAFNCELELARSSKCHSSHSQYCELAKIYK